MRGRKTILPPFIFITGYADLDNAVELLKLGACDYITKPFDLDRLLRRIRDITDHGAAASHCGAQPLGVSPAMRRLDKMLARVAPLDSTVLVTGETGSGKEIVARRIHALSGRDPFIAVNCAALVETLAESELFGHERGAFTGANHSHAGAFERASGGTLFLDEIGDMPLHLQAKLLRILQERSLLRVGGSRSVALDTRVLVATNCDLDARVADGKFREDLYFRINVVNLTLPALRERREDILWLARRFIGEFSSRLNEAPFRLDSDAEQYLMEHKWPGNVRELRHAIERACIFAGSDNLSRADLCFEINAATSADFKRRKLASYLADCERRYIENILASNAWRIGNTAELLGISRKSLWEKMKRFGIRQ
jgi:DNA-binding NtrC family response regulator